MIRRPTPTLRGRALMWLAQRDHSRAELQAKLRRWAADPDVAETNGRTAASDAEITSLLDELTEAGHLSDARFADSRVHARQARFGNLRIQQELRHLGVALGDEAKSQLRDTEHRRALDVWTRKFGSKPVTAHDRAKQLRFLAARGFSADTIRQVMAGVGDEP